MSKPKFKIDPVTGMPQLPSGQFWRVDDAGFMGLVTVRLMGRSGSRTREIENSSTRAHDDLALVAGYILERIAEDAATRASVASVTGDYPPKRFGKA